MKVNPKTGWPLKNPHAQALGAKGGKSKSKKKAAAARENGKLGGKPKKV